MEPLSYSLLAHYRVKSGDIFAKCRSFAEEFPRMDAKGILGNSHRVEFHTGLMNRAEVWNAAAQELKSVVCFDSNGYLGLQQHPEVKRAAIAALEKFGMGTPSVPLLGGTNRPLRELEKTIARFHGRDDALVFSSAYAANVSLPAALARVDDFIVYDDQVHASTLQGIALARCRQTVSFPACDLQALSERLSRIRSTHQNSGILVFVEGIYSMSGLVLNLAATRALCDQYSARLVIDECHSVGVIGERGAGLEDIAGETARSDLMVGCFSKAFGALGGYIVGSREAILYLRYFCSSYIFSTSLPAHFCAGMQKAIEVLEREPEILERLRANNNFFRQSLLAEGISVSHSESAIIGIHIPGNELLFNVGSELLNRSVKCGVVTYPAVKDHKGLLRLIVTALHSRAELEESARAISAVLRDYGVAAGTMALAVEQ